MKEELDNTNEKGVENELMNNSEDIEKEENAEKEFDEDITDKKDAETHENKEEGSSEAAPLDAGNGSHGHVIKSDFTSLEKSSTKVKVDNDETVNDQSLETETEDNEEKVVKQDAQNKDDEEETSGN